MEISDLIRQHRRSEGLSQKALAQLLGVDKSAVAQWETGATSPTAENMAAIKLVLRITDSVAVAEGSPYRGELIEDPDELALVDFWRGLTPVKRRAIVEMLQIGDKSARKSA